LKDLYHETDDQNNTNSFEDQRIDTPDDENKLSDRREYEDPEEIKKRELWEQVTKNVQDEEDSSSSDSN